MPWGLKLALNQMKLPPLMGVPLKFAELVDCAVHPGIGTGTVTATEAGSYPATKGEPVIVVSDPGTDGGTAADGVIA